MVESASLTIEWWNPPCAQGIALMTQFLQPRFSLPIFGANFFRKLDFWRGKAVTFEQAVRKSFVASKRVIVEFQGFPGTWQIIKFATCLGLLNLLFDVIDASLALMFFCFSSLF